MYRAILANRVCAHAEKTNVFPQGLCEALAVSAGGVLRLVDVAMADAHAQGEVQDTRSRKIRKTHILVSQFSTRDAWFFELCRSFLFDENFLKFSWNCAVFFRSNLIPRQRKHCSHVPSDC